MSAREALDIEYENGVADVLAFLAGDAACVERDVQLPGRRSGVLRQVDVLVRSRVFGAADATLIVDCKRWARPVDVSDAGAFLDLVEDVGGDVGLLVTTNGGSKAAYERTRQARGVRLEMMTLRELEMWAPPGTVSTEYRIPTAKKEAACRALRRAGLRVCLSDGYPKGEDEELIRVFRHYGVRSPSSECQTGQWEQARAAMAKAGIPDPFQVAHGVTAGGGTPAHRWLEVAVAGHPVGMKILAATEAEVEEQLREIRGRLARHDPPTDVVSYIKPVDWPVKGLFPGGLS